MPIIGSTIITGSLPAIGSPQWGGAVNGFLELFGQVLSQMVGVNSILIDGDLDMRSQALLNLQYLLGLNGVVDPDSPCTVYFKDDEFYVRDGAGNVVQLTNDGTLNAAALGGFTGDYGSSTGDANYSSANSRFTFSSEPGVAAAVDAGPLRVRNGAGSNIVALNAPSVLSASYTLTFPSGTPVEDHSLLRVSTVGIMQTTRDVNLNSVTASMATFSREVKATSFLHSGSSNDAAYRREAFSDHYPASCGNLEVGGRLHRRLRGLRRQRRSHRRLPVGDPDEDGRVHRQRQPLGQPGGRGRRDRDAATHLGVHRSDQDGTSGRLVRVQPPGRPHEPGRPEPQEPGQG